MIFGINKNEKSDTFIYFFGLIFSVLMTYLLTSILAFIKANFGINLEI